MFPGYSPRWFKLQHGYRVHVFAIDTNARPEGSISPTVAVPLVGPAPAALLTMTV
jgi:hypothetical protein